MSGANDLPWRSRTFGEIMFALLRRIASSLCYIPFSERNSPQTQLMRTSIRSNEPVTVTPREPLVRDYSVPQLPDDVMLMIFGELNMNEKFPLGTACKIFRKLDFEIGRKNFDYVSISWTDSKQCIEAFHGSTLFNYYIEKSNIIQSNYHNRRLFKQACALRVFVDYAKSVFDESDFSTIASMVKPLRYTNLEVKFRSKQDCSESFLESFVRNRNLKNARIKLSWIGRFNHDLRQIRELLMQLPRMDTLQISWQNISNESRKCLVNDATLLHICSMANVVEPFWANCTLQGILDVFQIVAKSSEYKYVGFYVTESAVNQFLSAPELNLTWNRFSYYYTANDRQTYVCVTRNQVMKHGFLQMEKCVGNERDYKILR
ncbi:hypothetical protein PRIPAC_94978 [Pristionchus pacificus]|uniref:Uncharacterized protein n=1 Tax=Pristionchus pacificus TaxID=54126 RepID=A0A2A6BA56_PRIPA|nr:hypothetical protein PRIPAC_94978 [Pristionchus pacificus]|eukprot:PDM62760.1 hypothetical protein PRIPAC_49975 [Pristionchus pacificus]